MVALALQLALMALAASRGAAQPPADAADALLFLPSRSGILDSEVGDVSLGYVPLVRELVSLPGVRQELDIFLALGGLSQIIIDVSDILGSREESSGGRLDMLRPALASFAMGRD